MLGIVFIGTAVGGLIMTVVLLEGYSVLIALLSYSATGSAMLAVSAIFRVLRIESAVRFSSDRALYNTDDLPAFPDLETMNEDSGSEIQPPQRTMRILAVDDDACVHTLVSALSREAGFNDVTSAVSGREAMELLEHSDSSFECILLDINMPEMDGIELCRLVRSLPKYSDTPIIMLTAMRDMDHMNEAFNAGANDYTTKPFDIIAFGERLKLACDQNYERKGAVSAKRAAAKGLRPNSTEPLESGPVNLLERRRSA